MSDSRVAIAPTGPELAGINMKTDIFFRRSAHEPGSLPLGCADPQNTVTSRFWPARSRPPMVTREEMDERG